MDSLFILNLPLIRAKTLVVAPKTLLVSVGGPHMMSPQDHPPGSLTTSFALPHVYLLSIPHACDAHVTHGPPSLHNVDEP